MECVWDALDRADWEALTRDAPLQQSWAYGEAMAALGAGVTRAALWRGGAVVGVGQVVTRRMGGVLSAATLMRGPIWTRPLSVDEEAEAYRALRAQPPFPAPRVFLISPNSEIPSPALGLARLRRVMTGYGTAELDLSQTADGLLAAMRGKWRNRLRSTAINDDAIRLSGRKASDVGWLLKRETAQQKERRYQGLPTAFVDAYAEAAGRDAMRLYRIDQDGAPAAAMLFLRHGRSATYHIGWASDAAKRLGAHNAILWRAMRDLGARGIRALDLGGVDTEASPGLARFKLGSGARPIALCGAYC